MAIKRINQNLQTVKVNLWGLEIGRLFWNELTGNSHFFFSPEYFKQPYDLTPLMCPKDSPEARLAIFGEKDDRIFQKLPAFLADSLPDQWGNAIFDRWFEENGYKSSDKTPLTKLSFIGRTSMGAFEFLPDIGGNTDFGEVDMAALYAEAKRFEDELSGRAVGLSGNITTLKLAALGTSPGGSRSKAIISQRPDGTFISGKTATSREDKHYIIKFNNPEYSLSETEYTWYQMALLSGIDMMPSRMEEIQGMKHFITERFDRRDGEKVMMQTFAALNRCDESYEMLFDTCRALGADVPQLEEMFRRTAFNMLTNNTDDHRKNFSFLMERDGVWHIAPAYDLTFILETGNRPCDTHCMSLGGKRSDVTIGDLLEFADKQGIRNAAAIIDRIIGAVMQFSRLAVENGIRSDFTEIIRERLKKLCPSDGLTLEARTAVCLDVGNGIRINDIRFERSEKGNIHILAECNGRTIKYVLTQKKDDYRNILNEGFNEMPENLKREYARKYLVSAAKKANLLKDVLTVK